MYYKDWKSVGVVEIELVDFCAVPRKKDWEKNKPYIRQGHLYTQRKPLEQLPFNMQIKFRCKNNLNCKEHVSALIGWQYMEAFRNFRDKYGSDENAFEVIKDKIKKSFADRPLLTSRILSGVERYSR
jgi:hypothetical protein